ncbi:MAG: hypothetical protein OXI91_11650 [Chloroflexota bacterium]|nr:hypothetical protein [Chloroflexota bacterium]
MSDNVKNDVHWVDKGEAARELEVSLSTLDRMIRKGEVEVGREGRRVYVKLPGPRYPSDRELLRQSRARVEEFRRKVEELAEEADQLEQERDQARGETEAAMGECGRLEAELVREQSTHQRTKRWVARLGIAVVALVVLLAVSGVVAWLLAS